MRFGGGAHGAEMESGHDGVGETASPYEALILSLSKDEGRAHPAAPGVVREAHHEASGRLIGVARIAWRWIPAFAGMTP
jgi:hypothetical protein